MRVGEGVKWGRKEISEELSLNMLDDKRHRDRRMRGCCGQIYSIFGVPSLLNFPIKSKHVPLNGGFRGWIPPPLVKERAG